MAKRLFGTLEDEDVRVDSETDREDESGDGCECQYDAEEFYEREEEDAVEHERNAGKPGRGLQRLARLIERRASGSGDYIKCLYE